MKKQLSIILAVLMVLGSFSLMSFSVSAEESTAPKNVADVVPEADANLTLRFYMPADWQTGSVSSPDECAAGIYWWDSSYAPSEWPGYKVTDKEAGNVFTAKVPADIKSVIFNNSVSGKPEAEKQTVNINAKGYAANENKFGFYPEGLDSVDGMIFVCNADYKNPTDDKSCEGSWFYYYGNGEYGAYKTKAEAEENKGIYSNGEFPKKKALPNIADVVPEADTNITLRFYMPDDWKNNYNNAYAGNLEDCVAAISWFDSSYAPSEWPGYCITDKEAGNVFTAKVPADIKSVIFNNSVSGKPEAEKQTININAKGYAANENKFGFYPEGLDSVDGMIFVCNADYKNPTDDKSCEGSWFYYYGNGEYGAYKTKAEAEENKGVYSKGEFPKTPEKPAEPTVEPTAKPTQPQTAKAETAKKENTLKVTAKAKSVNAKKLKKSKVTVSAITVKNAKGKVSYKKLSGSKKLSVTKKGKITVKKGTKKGTYKLKVKITAKGNSQYLARSVTKTVRVKVK